MALEKASIQIAGYTVFLGDCENHLVLVKVYEVPNELPDTAVISCLSYYGRVLSFHRDKVFQVIDNGVRTARMRVDRPSPRLSILLVSLSSYGILISLKPAVTVDCPTTLLKNASLFDVLIVSAPVIVQNSVKNRKDVCSAGRKIIVFRNAISKV